MRKGSKQGFTLIEVLVAVTILAVGVVGVLNGMVSLTRSQVRSQEAERVQRLAVEKLDELLATQQVQTTGLNGDFTDQNLQGYTWKADVTATGIESLQSLTVTVDKQDGGPQSPSAIISTLFYQAPVTTGGATQ